MNQPVQSRPEGQPEPWTCRGHFRQFFERIEAEGGDNRPDFPIRYFLLQAQGTIATGRLLGRIQGFDGLLAYQQLVLTFFAHHLFLYLGLCLIALWRWHPVYVRKWWFLCRSFVVCVAGVALLSIVANVVVMLGLGSESTSWDALLQAAIILLVVVLVGLLCTCFLFCTWRRPASVAPDVVPLAVVVQPVQ